jgi:uncharacterized protein (TIGR00369 family)
MDDPKKLIAGWIEGRLEPAPVARLVGFRLTSFDGGVARLEMEAGAQHHNPMGSVHGGILCDLADMAMGVAVAATLGEDETFTTLDLSARFLRTVRSAQLAVEGQVVQRGRTVVYAEAEVTDGDGRSIARFSSTCLVIRGGGG